jgi:hypothetical protein
MVILRPTQKLKTLLAPTTGVGPQSSDTALGDWYVNRIVVGRQPLLILVSSASLLPMLLPARDVRSLPARLADFVEARLQRCEIDTQWIQSEKRAMVPVAIGPTIDRSVLGIMVDFAKAIPYYLGPGQATETTLQALERHLETTPCHAGRSFGRAITPDMKTPELLRMKWG